VSRDAREWLIEIASELEAMEPDHAYNYGLEEAVRVELVKLMREAAAADAAREVFGDDSD
jgi:hypothetical protein